FSVSLFCSTDFDTRCQNVQCYIDCPSDSYLQNTMDALSYAKDETSERAKRAIVTNNHAHGRITIVPIGTQFFSPNNLQTQHQLRLKRDADQTELVDAGMDYTADNDPQLQELCCPKCICQPCPELPSCPPNFKPIVDFHEQTGQPGNCCPSFHCERNPMCYSETNHAWYVEHETWSEPPCTECKCQAGENRCEIPACKPLNCEHQINLPDRCCPVCDPAKSHFCEDHNCEVQCRNGYERRGNCSLCSCAQLPPPEPTTGKTTETPALMANYTSSTMDETDELFDAGKDQNAGAEDGFFSNLTTLGCIIFVIVVALSISFIYSLVSIESVKKVAMWFSCNEIPQRKSAYNRVSSTVVPVTPPPPNGTTANSMA
uniref:VWFC domain-containing protein n=1 Tax=Anopheles maculatus TaxID=74869 RepID=A0A182S5S0_9DIPT